jgi:integrase
MAVRTTTRRGKRVLVIDFLFRKPDGTKGRYRHDAEVQTRTGALAEERRRLAALAATGSPFEVLDKTARGQVAPEPPAPVGPTFSEVVKQYRAKYLPTQKASTRYSYTTMIEARLLPWFGKVAVTKVDASAVREFHASMASDGLKLSTRRTILTVLRSIVCRYAVEAKLLAKAPELPKLPRKGKTTVLAPSRGQVLALLAAACSAHKLVFALAAFAGLRACEIRELRWRDVDLTAGVLVIRLARCRGVIDMPKSGDDRIIPIAHELRKLLEARGSRPRDEHVALTVRGKPWGDDGLKELFQRVATRAAIEGFHFHCLRHFFITELFRRGVGAPTVQKLAGHAHLETTARYAHCVTGDLHDAIYRLSEPESEAPPVAAQ